VVDHVIGKREEHNSRGIVGFCFLVYASFVRFNRARAEAHYIRYLLIGLLLANELYYLLLGLGQVGFFELHVAVPFHHSLYYGRGALVEKKSIFINIVDGIEHLVNVGILSQKATGAGLYKVINDLLIIVHGDDDNLDGRIKQADLPRGF
jgi:hypothetical protein